MLVVLISFLWPLLPSAFTETVSQKSCTSRHLQQSLLISFLLQLVLSAITRTVVHDSNTSRDHRPSLLRLRKQGYGRAPDCSPCHNHPKS
ncbi:hypothetical protein M758_UG281400 [Ceratodon purpureus]|nr:hypothetical protein M758_UG281400 [Ceratodon purpureus]